MTSVPNPSSLVHRRGDAGLPSTGRWTLHLSSFVGISHGRDRLQPFVIDGALTVADPSDRSTLDIDAVLDDRRVRLTASTARLHPVVGFSCWHLLGTLDDGIASHHVELDMTYHGLRRRSSGASAWFTGRASTSTAVRRLNSRRADLTVVLDLLFTAPNAHPARLLAPRVAA